ncbi:LOW QUALITY PROTEIN: U-box domain-containing protein 73-like [Miscanthus floridulus]|uniref:LOW QUALITY PROTEIN: U-box domain-containing protein 73-like n=1 Tax=Miscanthus floridulus TaxID=154761 RepID=UPI00345A18D4
MSLRRSSHTSSADETLENELRRAIEGEIIQENARASSAQQPPSGCWPSSPSSLVRGVARRLLAVATSPSDHTLPTRRLLPRSPQRGRQGAGRRVLAVAASPSDRTLPTPRSPPRSPHQGQAASSDVPGTSGSVPQVPTRSGSEEEARLEQDQAAHTRSAYGATMRSALAKIQEQEGTHDHDQEQAAFGKMEEAIAGLMELTYGTAELQNPPELPREFATRFPYDDADSSHSGLSGVMEDPVILASGYSVDQLYHLFCSPNVCPSTKETLSHTLTAPNHLLRDMIAAWRLDHMARSSSNNADTLSIPVEPSEEQIQAILQKFSGHSVMQEQALHEIQLLSKTTKGEQPCLHKCAGLLPGLIDLQKNWKSTWSQELEEQRPGVILDLSVHRPNREILAGANQLPVLLKKIIHKLRKHGSPASHLAKVASIVAILSEFDMFRKRVLDIGGMEMLRDLLRIEDVFVRKEAVTAIRGLCADEEGKINAQSYNVPDALLEYLMVSDEVLLLLDCLRKNLHMVDKMCDKAMELVNIIMAEEGTRPVTPEATYSAISLVHAIVQRDVHKMEQVKNLEDFKERLRELSSGTLPMQTMLKLDTIINCLSKEFPAPVNP